MLVRVGEAVGFEAYFLAIDINGAYANLTKAWHLTVDVFYTKAAFVVINQRAFVLDDFWVNECSEVVVFSIFKITTNNDDTLKRIDLNSRKCRTNFMRTRGLPVDCGIGHILNQFKSCLVDFTDFLGLLTQVVVREGDDIVFGHLP